MRPFVRPTLGIALAASLGGCVAAPPPRPVVYAPPPPPAPPPVPVEQVQVVPAYQPVLPLIVERRPPPPVSAEVLIWRPGHWHWNGTTYVWNRGAYEPRGVHGARWVHGHWRRAPGGWLWVPAHWN